MNGSARTSLSPVDGWERTTYPARLRVVASADSLPALPGSCSCQMRTLACRTSSDAQAATRLLGSYVGLSDTRAPRVTDNQSAILMFLARPTGWPAGSCTLLGKTSPHTHSRAKYAKARRLDTNDTCVPSKAMVTTETDNVWAKRMSPNMPVAVRFVTG